MRNSSGGWGSLKMDVPPLMHSKLSPLKSFAGHNAGETEALPNQNGVSWYSGSLRVFFLFQDYSLKGPCDCGFLV